jgi:ABC-type uncharacterized transport system permease subunit
MELLAQLLFGLTASAYVVATVIFLRYLVSGVGDVAKLGPRLVALGALMHAAHICVASILTKQCPVNGIHFPMSVASMFMCVAFVALRKRYRVEVAGAFIAPLALTSLMASQLVANTDEQLKGVRNVILPFHVTSNLFGIALFGLAFSAAALYLVQERLVKRKRIDGVSRRLPPLDALDRAEHRFLLAGFPLLTIGIVTGTVFARNVEMGAPGDALRAAFSYVTWLVIAGVLFLRAAAGWRGRRAAYGTIAGFGLVIVVLVLYLTRSPAAPAATALLQVTTP